jgi:hypothetical protein
LHGYRDLHGRPLLVKRILTARRDPGSGLRTIEVISATISPLAGRHDRAKRAAASAASMRSSAGTSDGAIAMP